MKKSISTLLTITMLGGLCISCNRNLSSRPELAPFVGKTVVLRKAHYICAAGSQYDLRRVYPDDDGASCTSVDTLDVGSEVKVLRFVNASGILSWPGRVKAILEISIPSRSNQVVSAELLVKNGEEKDSEFPW